jgi:hypothetical protein
LGTRIKVISLDDLSNSKASRPVNIGIAQDCTMRNARFGVAVFSRGQAKSAIGAPPVRSAGSATLQPTEDPPKPLPFEHKTVLYGPEISARP